MVPGWKKEFDALIEETLAFAASVNGTPVRSEPDTMTPADIVEDEVVQADLPVLATVEAVLAEEPTAPSPLPEAPSKLRRLTFIRNETLDPPLLRSSGGTVSSHIGVRADAGTNSPSRA